MMKAWPRFLRRSIRNKILLLSILLAVVPSVTIGLLSYYRVSGELERQAQESFRGLLYQAQVNISYRVKEAEDTAGSLMINPELLDILKESRGSLTMDEMLDNYKRLSKIFVPLQASLPSLHRIRLFVYGQPQYVKERNTYFCITEAQDFPIYQKLSADKRYLGWSGAYDNEYIFQDRQTVVSLGVRLMNPQKAAEEIGFVMLDMSVATLQEIIDGVPMPENALLLLTCAQADGGIITSKAGKSFPAYDFKCLFGLLSSSEDMIQYQGTQYMVTRQTVENAGWILISMVPVEVITQTSQQTLNYTLLLAGLFIIVAVFMGVSISNALTGRIRKLSRHMDATALSGNLESVTIAGDDEISRLSHHYNNMILKIQNLLGTVYRMEIERRKMEMSVLEGQINPHFLYNTLDTIKWTALRSGAEQTAKTAEALSRFFRLSLNRGQEMMTVEEEIRHVEAYLEIQNARMDNRIAWTNRVDPEIYGEKMLKLVLQPIVENAAMHGIRASSRGSGTVTLSGRREGGDLVFIVEDNGAGMTREQMESILCTDTPGYGVYNVHQRIRLYYGNRYGLSYEGGPGQGTRVTILLGRQPAADQEAPQ